MAHVMSKPPECTRRCDGLHRSGVTPIGQYDVCRIKHQGYQNGSEWLCQHGGDLSEPKKELELHNLLIKIR